MKQNITVIGSVVIFVIICSYCTSKSDLQEFNGLYLGQKKPGKIPELFAPGIVSTPEHEHSRLEFSRDGKEIFWAVLQLPVEERKQYIMHVYRREKIWTAPSIFLNVTSGSPTLSHDGKALFYITSDPDSDKNIRPRKQLLWKVERKGSGWGEPQIERDILPQIDRKVTMSFCFADNGNLYYDLGGPGEDGSWEWDIWKREFQNKKYANPEKLGNGINEGSVNWTPFVSLDESYLIFSSDRMNNGDSGDHFITFRKQDGQWTHPVSMGASVNTSHQERFPSVSPDGKYFFYARNTPENHSEIFWVEAGFIDDLKLKALKNIKE